ncbi:baseplate assembly protein [Martelella mediterranea]|uniref:Uncharacterized protein n=1 Tax=Martelella mediterranea TaxID=293089 RepID=A0A4R3NUK0_9HYPH|nr:baseplate assembly protein [Martelella mediterranea]TCT41148.1 hypothetical protein EDC90_1007125 [Martelella mediterranea]
MRAGLDAETGKVLTGWDHCVQSIGKCISTRYASRPARRHIGSVVPELQDANAGAVTIFKTFSAIAEAINDPDTGEPGFSLQSIAMTEYGRAGRFAFQLNGIFYPRGHLGDYSISEARSLTVPGSAS